MSQPGAYDYRTSQASMSGHEHAEGITDQVSEFGARVETMAGELVVAIKQRPYTTLAIAASLAFAVGALWKLGHQRPQTRLEALRARMPDVRGRVPELPSWDGLLQRWRR